MGGRGWHLLGQVAQGGLRRSRAVAHVACARHGVAAYRRVGRRADWGGARLRAQLESTNNVACPEWLDWFHGGLQFQIECATSLAVANERTSESCFTAMLCSSP